MTRTAPFNKNKTLSNPAALLLATPLIFGQQACGGGVGNNTVTPPTVPSVSVRAASLSDTTATAGEDCDVTTGILTIPANSTTTISVPLVGDTNIEFDESFNLAISNAKNATITNNTQTVIGTVLFIISFVLFWIGTMAGIE